MTTLAGLTPEMCDMVVQTLRQVVKRDLPDERVLALDQAETFPEEFIRTLLSPDVGLHLLFLPESVGGLGGGARDICLVSEEMAGIDLGVATAFLAICLGTDPIIVGGTPEQKSRWLSRIASEGMIVAYGVTEPAAGSNVAALQTRAEPVRDPGGAITHYRLNGAKQFITNGGVAQIYTILAQAPAGPSFFVVERDTPGVSVGRQEDKHGIRASNTTSVLLEDVLVPADQLIGIEEGRGLRQANAVFGYTRLMVGAFGLGAGQMALDRALAYARSRIQFGSPLIEKQGYTHKLLVPNWIDLAAGRAYVREVALRIDSGEHDLQVEGSIAKLWCTEAGNRAADAALQAFGGYGYTREYMVEKIRRDVRITSIYEGTSEIQQVIIGLFRWKEAVRSRGAFYREAAAVLDALHARRPEVGAGFAAGALRTLGEAILHCHASGATKHQIAQFTLADMATAAEVAGSFCRLTAAEADAGAADADARVAMSRQCARQALATVRRGALQCALGQVDPADEAQLAQAAPAVASLAPAEAWRTLAGGWRDLDLIADHLRALG